MLSDPEFFECELLTVSREQAEFAASEVSGCKACSESAEIPFDWILADAMNLHGMFEFVLAEPVKCPLCHAPVSERTWWIVAGWSRSKSSCLPEAVSE